MFPSFLQTLTQTASVFLSQDPTLRLLQGVLLVVGFLVLYLLFWTLRDVLLRTTSFWYQILCILLVALLPIVGFLLYLLVRPARTIKEREVEEMLKSLKPKKKTESSEKA